MAGNPLVSIGTTASATAFSPFATDAAFVAAKGSAAANGDTYLNTTYNELRTYAAGAWRTSPKNISKYNPAGDNATDDYSAFASAATDLASGGELWLGPYTYYIASDLTFSGSDIHIRGASGLTKIRLADGKKISFTGSRIRVSDIWFDGTLATTHTSTGRLLDFHGTSAASYSSDIQVSGCRFTNAPFYGLYTQFVDGITISECMVDTVANAGIILLSTNNFVIAETRVKNINTDEYFLNAYGVIVSELQCNNGAAYTASFTSGSSSCTVSGTTDLAVGDIICNSNVPVRTTITNISGTTLTLSAKATGTAAGSTTYFTHPNSKRGTIDAVVVTNNPLWEGIDSHSGEDIEITSCSVRDCKKGIVVGNSGSSFGIAPQRITIGSCSVCGFNDEDNTKTATGSSLTVTMSAAPNFTVRAGNFIIFGSQIKRIATVTSQTVFVIEASDGVNSYTGAFSPQPSADSVTVTNKGSSDIGIALTGDPGASAGSPRELAGGCSVTNVSVHGFGGETNALGSAVYFHNTKGLVFSGSISEPNGIGILSYYDNYGATYDFSVVDAWGYYKTDPCALKFGADYQSATVNKYSIISKDKSAPYVNVRGITFGAALSNISISIGDGVFTGSSYFLSNLPTGALFDTTKPRRTIFTGSIPTTGTWKKGDIAINTAVAVNGTLGWICTADGSPGTWLIMPLATTAGSFQVGRRITALEATAPSSTADAVLEAQAEGTGGDAISQYTFVSTTDKWAAGMKRTDKSYRVGYDAGDATHGRLGVADFLQVTTLGNAALGKASMATNATDGFLHIPVCAGTPTGVPTGITGYVPMIFDSTNLYIYVYTGGAWKKVLLA